MAAWLYKQKGSKKWWLGYRANGKQFLRSTQTADKEKALRQKAKVEMLFEAHKAGILDELYETLSSKTIPKVSLRAALDSWLEEVANSTGEGTLDRYTPIAEEFAKFIGAGPERPLITEIATEQIQTHLDHRRKKCSASTTNLERKILSMFFNRAVKRGQLKSNPTLSIPPYRSRDGEEQKRRAFTTEELTMLYGKAPDDFWRYMVLGGFYTGLRLGDLVKLAWPSVDFAANVLNVRTKKTGKALHIPMARPLRAILDKVATDAGNPKAGHVWPERAKQYLDKGAGPFSNEFYDVLLAPCGLVDVRENKKGRKSGRKSERFVNPVSFHSFRHTFVSLLKATGGSSAVAKELAGHSSDLISNAYTHLPADVLAKAIDALSEVGK